MDILFHVKCMFPKDKLFRFPKTSNEARALRTVTGFKVEDVMRDSLDALIRHGICKTNIQISCVNEAGKSEIFVTILDNINVLKIAKILGLEKPLRTKKVKTLNLGDRYFLSSFDGYKAEAA